MATTPTAMVTIHSQVAADVGKRAAEVLKREGLTVDEAVRQMLTRTANDGVLPFRARDAEGNLRDEDPDYNAWFCAKVDESLNDERPAISREELDRRMAGRRAAAKARLV